VAAADGSMPKRVAGLEKRGCFAPAFTPDGRRILFLVESWPNGPSGVPKRGLWEVDLTGGEPSELADYGLLDDALGWKPRPAEIKRR
jgi:hypothetical protein